MDTPLFIVLFVSLYVTFVNGDSVSGCPAPDPNCHPSDIVYDAAHCRYCRTPSGFMSSGSSGSSSSWSTGSGSSNGGGSGSSSWDNSFGSSDWSTAVNSEKDAFSGSSSSGSGNSGFGNAFSSSSDNSFSGNGFSSGSSSNTGNSHSETTKYVIIEKQPEHSYTENIYPDIHPGNSLLPNTVPGSGSPFSVPSNMGHGPSGMGPGPSGMGPGSSGMGPGSIPSFPGGIVSSGSSSYTSSSSNGRIVHVPLLAPGVPKYCVRGRILSCPSTCEKVDEWGCKSCPCAPARFQTMPVIMGGIKTHTVECAAIKLCARICENGYYLGDIGQDGCRKCSCKAKTAPSNQEPSCPETLKCMLKCKDGYYLGDKQSNGCPYCRCLTAKESASHSSSNAQSSGNSNSNNGKLPNNGWHTQGQTNDNSGGGSSLWTGSGSGSGNNVWTGSGSGQLTGSGSTGSNNILQSHNGVGNGDCKPPMCLDPNMSEKDAMEIGKASANGGLTHNGMGGGMTSPGASGSGSGSDGCKPPMCFGGGQTMGSLTGGSSGSSGSCQGPFCASGNGMGIGGAMGSGSGSNKGGSAFSPFSSALSGGGSKLSGSSGGYGTSQGGFSSVSVGQASTEQVSEQRNCPGLFHCLVTCDGKYSLGPLDNTGCQTCSCS